MPLQWRRGQNPYMHNYFGILGVGPNTSRNEIAFRENQLRQIVKRSPEPLKLGELVLVEQMISEAGKRLLDDQSRVMELPLVHPEVKLDKKKLEEVKKKLRDIAVLPDRNEPIRLLHPLAVFWFVLQPGPEAAEWPQLEDFDLVQIGDSEDLGLDFVFDS